MSAYLTFMSTWFVPYKKSRPAPMTINGHRLVIVSPDKADLEENLSQFGGDRIKTIDLGLSEEDQKNEIERLAKSVNGGVVIAPENMGFDELLENLKEQLPWVH